MAEVAILAIANLCGLRLGPFPLLGGRRLLIAQLLLSVLRGFHLLEQLLALLPQFDCLHRGEGFVLEHELSIFVRRTRLCLNLLGGGLELPWKRRLL